MRKSNDENSSELENNPRFNEMLEAFFYFATKAPNPIVPCAFLSQLVETTLERTYHEIYNSIAETDSPQSTICAAQHVLKCKELTKEIIQQLAAAARDLHLEGSPLQIRLRTNHE